MSAQSGERYYQLSFSKWLPIWPLYPKWPPVKNSSHWISNIFFKYCPFNLVIDIITHSILVELVQQHSMQHFALVWSTSLAAQSKISMFRDIRPIWKDQSTIKKIPWWASRFFGTACFISTISKCLDMTQKSGFRNSGITIDTWKTSMRMENLLSAENFRV